MTKLKQAQESLKTVSDKKEQLIKKYKTYISNIEWHISVNGTDEITLSRLNAKIEIYTEFINDLKFL